MTAIDTTYSPRLDSLNDLNEKIDESKSIPLFPKATSLLFNSGNVVSSDRLKKRTNLNPQEEVSLTYIIILDFTIVIFSVINSNIKGE